MLTMDIKHDQVYINQKMTAPAVYCDHWAIMEIAENLDSASKFKDILLHKQGTLMLSWINLLEFSEITIREQIDKVENFIESLSPNLGFIDVIPTPVIKKEDECLRGERTTAPHADSQLLSFFGGMERTSLNPLNPKGLFAILNQPKMVEMNKKFHLQFSKKIEELKKQVKSNPKLQSQVSKPPQGKNIHTLTRYLERDILNSLIRDTNSGLPDSNDWRDFYHTIVPVSYCDFVLLDRSWAHKANESITRLRNSGFTSNMAKIFSKKNLNSRF